MSYRFDTVSGRDELLIALEIQQTAEAAELTTARATAWLEEQLGDFIELTPETDLGLLYKTVWAFVMRGHRAAAERILDHIQTHLRQPSGDICNPTGEFDPVRLYRQTWILRAARELDHPLQNVEECHARLRQYQAPTGGAYDYIGEDPDKPVYPAEQMLLITAALGLWAVEYKQWDVVRGVLGWISDLVEQNRESMERGRFYFATDEHGRVLPARDRSEAFFRYIDISPAVQPTHTIGLATAFLVDAALNARTANEPDLEKSAIALTEPLLRFTTGMPIETFFSWNHCKFAWVGGELIRYQLAAGVTELKAYDDAYRMTRRALRHTLTGTTNSDGSWNHDIYPADPDSPEASIDQRTLEGISAIPAPEEWETANGGPVAYADSIEVTAENSFVTEYARQGITALLDAVKAGDVR